MLPKLLLILSFGLIVLAFIFFRNNDFPNDSAVNTEQTYIEDGPHQRQLWVEERLKYEFEMLRDPKTGEIPFGIRQQELELARTLPRKENIDRKSVV